MATERLFRRFLVGGAMLAWALGGCTVKKPEMPTTHITLRIPVANDTTTIREVAQDRPDYLEITEDGRLTLDFSSDIDERESVGERLSIKPQAARFETPTASIGIRGTHFVLSVDD